MIARIPSRQPLLSKPDSDNRWYSENQILTTDGILTMNPLVVPLALVDPQCPTCGPTCLVKKNENDALMCG